MRISDWSSDVCSSDLAENKYAVGLSLGSGVQMTGTARIDTQGSLPTTNNSLDLAIEGSGYFQVEMPDGTIGSTRAGTFSLSSEGVLVTSDGLPLQPQIQLPDGASHTTLGHDGAVSATLAARTATPPHNTK